MSSNTSPANPAPPSRDPRKKPDVVVPYAGLKPGKRAKTLAEHEQRKAEKSNRNRALAAKSRIKEKEEKAFCQGKLAFTETLLADTQRELRLKIDLLMEIAQGFDILIEDRKDIEDGLFSRKFEAPVPARSTEKTNHLNNTNNTNNISDATIARTGYEQIQSHALGTALWQDEDVSVGMARTESMDSTLSSLQPSVFDITEKPPMDFALPSLEPSAFDISGISVMDSTLLSLGLANKNPAEVTLMNSTFFCEPAAMNTDKDASMNSTLSSLEQVAVNNEDWLSQAFHQVPQTGQYPHPNSTIASNSYTCVNPANISLCQPARHASDGESSPQFFDGQRALQELGDQFATNQFGGQSSQDHFNGQTARYQLDGRPSRYQFDVHSTQNQSNSQPSLRQSNGQTPMSEFGGNATQHHFNGHPALQPFGGPPTQNHFNGQPALHYLNGQHQDQPLYMTISL